MSRFQKATREAAAILNGEMASPSEWFHIVRQCDLLLAGIDQPIRSAVAVARLVVAEPERNRRATLARMGLDHDPLEPANLREREELRAVALFVTRATMRGAEGSSKLLLAGLKRSMLGDTPPVKSFEAALRGWSHAMAAAAGVMDPPGALLVSRAQDGLLRAGSNLLHGLEVTDGVGHDRLAAAVDASREEWGRACTVWRGLVPRNTRSTADLQPAFTAVQLAAQGVDGAERLQALLATGFGGNLTAALTVTPQGLQPRSVLVTNALTLERRSDLAHHVQPKQAASVIEPLTGQGRQQVRIGPAVVFSDQASPVTSSRPSRPKAAEPEIVDLGDVAGLARLARQRDAGQLAGAALAGVEGAAALVGGVGVAELEKLVERGRDACGSLVVSALPMVYHFLRKVHPNEYHEFVSAASAQLLKQAEVWDPSLSKWSTFTYRGTDLVHKDANRHFNKWREVVSDEAVGLADQRRIVGSVQRAVEDQVVDGLDQSMVQPLIEKLPYRLRTLLESRLDDPATATPATLADVAAQFGHSSSTAHRYETSAHQMLRDLYVNSQTEPSSTAAVTLHHLAFALRPPRETARARLQQREWRAPGAGSPPPAR